MANMAAKKRPRKKAPSRPADAPPAGKIGKGTDIESVRLLVALMVENDLTEVNIEDGDVKVLLRRGGQAPVYAPGAAPAASAAPPPAAVAVAEPPAAAEEELLEIKSPMVGTFYTSASPDAEAYVGIDDRVDEDRVVCIVEAMKVMNEIKAECSGTIAEICVQNAQPVEYGQTLFRVRPD